MNKARQSIFFTVLAAAFLAAGCSRNSSSPVSALNDQPIVAEAKVQNLTEYAPGYGISTMETGRLEFAVNIEAADTHLISSGESATAYVAPSSAPIHCRVVQVLRGVSAETGQSIAWLRPTDKMNIPIGNFVDARIVTGVLKNVLAVPPSAVLFKAGSAWVIRVEAASSASMQAHYTPTPVTLGDVTDEAVEIKSGIHPGDGIVIQGGIGYLYPDFKAESDD